jgi:glutathione S-transferase
MIIIYHIESRRSERVVWLLEELGVKYELRFVPGDLVSSRAQMLASGHPYAMAPVVRDGDQWLVESGAILETLLNRYGHGRLRPAPESPDHPAYLQWLHFAEGTLLARSQQEAMVRLVPPEQAQHFPPRKDASLRIAKYIDDTLADRPWFAGVEFSAADIMMHYPLRICLSIAAGRDGTPVVLIQPDAQCVAPYPHISAWLDRVAARPAFQRMRTVSMPLGWPSR